MISANQKSIALYINKRLHPQKKRPIEEISNISASTNKQSDIARFCFDEFEESEETRISIENNIAAELRQNDCVYASMAEVDAALKIIKKKHKKTKSSEPIVNVGDSAV